MTSEHHGGFAGYMAQPLQMASFILEEHTTGWAAAAPLLLPLRPRRSWPKRWRGCRPVTGAASASGWRRAPSPWTSTWPASARTRPWTRSRRSCRGSWPCCGERSWANSRVTPPCVACRNAPVPVLSAAVSVAAVDPGRRLRSRHPDGGHVGAGAADPSDPSLRRGRRDRRQGADPPGMAGPRAVRAGRDQRAVYESYASGTRRSAPTKRSRPMIRAEVADRLAAAVVEVGADALNLRVQLPGMTPEQVREQIEQIGSTVAAAAEESTPHCDVGSPNYRIGVHPLERWFPPSTSRVIAGDLPCVIGQEETHRRRDVLCLGQPTERERRSRRGAVVGLPEGRVAVVRTNPGLTAFSRTPCPARSAATVRVMALSAALAAAYETMAEVVLRGEPLEIVTTEPAFSAQSSGERGSNESEGRPSVEPERLEELLLADGVERQRMGRTANRADEQVDATEGLQRPVGEQRGGLLGVHGSGDADDVEAFGAKGRLGRRSRSSSRPLMTTDAPSLARRRAHERPMLGSAVEPVTMATRPAKRWPLSAGSIVCILSQDAVTRPRGSAAGGLALRGGRDPR